jgi:nitrogen fixation NifU-like protein
MELTDLYREVILDHNRSPRNFGRLDPHDAEAKGHNPLCGDRLTITANLADGRIQDLRFEGNGCAISVASASLMTEAVKGKTLEQVRELFEQVHSVLTTTAADTSGLGKLAALAGVREYPARVKCASLCWNTLNAALDQPRDKPADAAGAISTE